jgi:hypothetical protein
MYIITCKRKIIVNFLNDRNIIYINGIFHLICIIKFKFKYKILKKYKLFNFKRSSNFNETTENVIQSM